MQRKIILESGYEFIGEGFGSEAEVINEIVFNTAMIGYQEVMSDPTCNGLIVVMSYPLIGNYGVTDEDFESKVPSLGGMIVREYNDHPSNFRSTKTLSEVFEEYNIPGISQIDTRELVRIIRKEGSQKALITDMDTTLEEGVKKLKATTLAKDQVKKVTSKKIWYSRTANYLYNVVAVDCGIKLNIIRKLNELGCNVTIVPYDSSAEVIMNLHPDGLLISNGPGNPEDVGEVIELVKTLQGKLPIFGIGLGHQLIGLANGLKIYKMKVGHHGGNHPVKNILNGKIEITAQGHSYAIDAKSVENKDIQITHLNLLDQSVEGLSIEAQSIFSTQFHPESAPGPKDSQYLFNQFIDNIVRFKVKGGK